MERSTDDDGSWGDTRPYPDSMDAAAATLGDPADSHGWLHRTIETEIIPRLMLAHRATPAAPPGPGEGGLDRVGPDDVESFTDLVLRDDLDACASFVAAIRERGVGLECVFLGLLAPSARRLGVLWEEDRCDFAQVTLGLWRLQSLVLDLSPDLPVEWPARGAAPRRALLAAAPGSQHTLGLLMVAEFFRRSGWEVWSDPCASEGDLAALLRSEWFDLVGLSVGMDGHVPPTRSVILALRRASRNPGIGVMVGGPIAAGRPRLVAEVGADFTAVDARQAVERAMSFVAMRCLSS